MATAKKAKPAATSESLVKKAAPRRRAATKAAVKKTAAPKAAKAAPKVAAAKPAPTHEEIEVLAYKLWEERGRPEGAGHEDWVRAEEILQGS